MIESDMSRRDATMNQLDLFVKDVENHANL